MNSKRFMLRLDDDIVEYLQKKGSQEKYAEFIRQLIRDGIEYRGMSRDLVLKALQSKNNTSE